MFIFLLCFASSKPASCLKNSKITLETFDILPEVPKSGEEVSLNFIFQADSSVTHPYLEFRWENSEVPLFRKLFEICDNKKEDCRTHDSRYTFNRSIVIPSGVRQGSYDCKMIVHNKDRSQVGCYHFDITYN